MAPSKETAVATTTTKSNPNNEKDGPDLALSLLYSLLELGVTLTASYLFSKWIASKIQGNAAGGGDMDGFMEGSGGGGGGGGVVSRLEKLLVARHEATLKAMMEELEDHQLTWKNKNKQQEEEEEEKKEHDDDTNNNNPNNHDYNQQNHTKRQYDALSQALTLQHQHSLSTLTTLTPYEMSIAQGNVIDPSNLSVTFGDVGGMDDIKSEIYDLVVLPLLRPDLFMSDSGLVSPPKGILLYGPPGTGKTMLAKAIAKESHATFVNVQLSTIMNKWFGESNKLISATFHLARKLAPSVVFIDEMDAFLSQRDGTEGSAVNSMKSEFLTLWDGLLSERKGNTTSNEEEGSPDDDSGTNGAWSWNGKMNATSSALLDTETPMALPPPPIIVLGATNRPYDVDPAILRRLPRSFEIPLPSLQSRLQLLTLFLERQDMTPAAKAFLPTLARRTEGYSGSDLKEVCRAAAWEPVRELTTGASRRAAGCVVGGSDGAATSPSSSSSSSKRTSTSFPPRGTKARPVNENDFLLAIHKVKRTGESAREFHKKEFVRGREERANMAAEISRESSNGSSSSSGRKTRIKKGVDGDKNATKAENNGQVVNVDMQQIMAMVAAAASMNGPKNNGGISFDDFGLGGRASSSQESDDEENDDDGPPDMSGKASE